MSRPQPSLRNEYRFFAPITTRWNDNDIYGHVNNVAYYAYFDTVANVFLIEQAQLDIHQADVVGFVVNSGCNYFAPIAFPEKINAGLRVNRLGASSVEYGIAIFKEGEELAAAEGHFVHVFVERKSNKSVPIPESIRQALEKIRIAS